MKKMEKKKFRIAVLASSKGTDLQAIIDEIKAERLDAELACVISNKKECFALERAHAQGFKTYFVDPKEKSRIEYDREVAAILKNENVDLIVLAGYMRILSAYFVGEFKGRIINVHPALLPKYGGKDFFGMAVHAAVIQDGEKESGMTIHFVDEGVDTGKIILQKKLEVRPEDTPKSLRKRVVALEKEWYPKVIQMFVEGKVSP